MAQSILAKTDTGEIQLTITIPTEKVEESYKKYIDQAVESAVVPGFRKGKAPKNIVEEKVDKSKIYEQVLQEIVPEAYVEAIQEHKIQPLVPPHVELIKAKEGEDWEIRATTAEKPEVKLDNYKEKIRSEIAPSKLWTPDKKEKTKEESSQPDHDEKMHQVMQVLPKVAEITIPHILIDDEVNRALSNLLGQTEKLGITVDQYLASVGKTPDQLREEYHVRVENDLKLQFILDAIAENEKIEVKEDEIEGLITASGDESLKQSLTTPESRAYLKAIIARRKVLDLLSNL